MFLIEKKIKKDNIKPFTYFICYIDIEIYLVFSVS